MTSEEQATGPMRFQNQPLTTGYVVWDPDERSEQLQRWVALKEALPDDIIHVRRSCKNDVESFLLRQLAVFVFDANRLEGTISPKHAQGPTMAVILAFFTGTAAEPERVSWDSEGGREPSSPSSKRQLFQAVASVDYLMRKNVNSPLTAELITETHRLMTEGSFVGTEGKPLAAGVFRTAPGDLVFAGNHQFLAPEHVAPAINRLCSEYERRRQQNEHPIAVATYLFYELITIHPFMNGNGRLCRMMLAWSLMRDGFPFPVSFASTHGNARRNYLHAIERARGANHREGKRMLAELNVTALVSVERTLNNFQRINAEFVLPPVALSSLSSR